MSHPVFWLMGVQFAILLWALERETNRIIKAIAKTKEH